jgi:hypothetical protein
VSFQRSFIVENWTRLVAGLLASGHYTRPGIEGEDDPRLIAYDAGEEWIEEGHPRKFPRLVIDDAESLLDDILKLSELREDRERERRLGQ